MNKLILLHTQQKHKIPFQVVLSSQFCNLKGILPFCLLLLRSFKERLFKLPLDPQEVRFRTLAGSAALLPVQSQSDLDLAFPQWNGAESRHLDFICRHFIVALDQPDLRRSLDGDVFAQL